MHRDELYARAAAQPVAVDALGVAVLVLLLVVPTWAATDDAVALVSLGLVVPLVARRTAPGAVVAAVLAAAACQWLLMVGGRELLVLPADVGVLVALYSVAAYGGRAASRTALGAAIAASGMLGVALLTLSPAAVVLAGFGVLAAAGSSLAAWTLGDLRRVRLAAVAALRERADRLERERDREARLAASDERARIAREMHDVVAHSLSVVIAQADGGRYAAASSPEAAVAALTTVAETGRTALADMRRLLGVLRDDTSAGTAPQPGVGDVPALVDSVRESGVPVSLVQVGAPRALPPALGLAAYRIVQEGLTNVLKHAGPGTATTVALCWAQDALEVQVEDEGGTVPPSPGTGHGLVGMQERAALYGGSVVAGPRPGGGHRLHVRLPYP